MAQAQAQTDDEPIDTDWLKRNGDLIDFGDESIRQSESWERAKTEAGEADVDRLDERGRFQVRLPDGDRHETMLVSTPNEKEYAGSCDCRGHRMHGSPCAHLCTLAMRDVMNDIIPRDESLAQEIAFGASVDQARSADPDEPGAVVATTADDVDTTDAGDDQDVDDVVDEEPGVPADEGESLEEASERVDPEATVDDPDDDPQGQTDEKNAPAPADVERPKWAQTLPDGALSDPIQELPDWMLTQVDRRDGDVDLNKRGCQVVARTLGLDFDVDHVVEARDVDWEYATVRVTVTDTDGVEHVATANAMIDEDNVSKDGIDEMAETRAKKRAVKWATGGGLEALIETADE